MAKLSSPVRFLLTLLFFAIASAACTSALLLKAGDQPIVQPPRSQANGTAPKAAHPARTTEALPNDLPKAPASLPMAMLPDRPVRQWTTWEGQPLPGAVRSRKANEARLPIVLALFDRAGVPFPPAQMAFVVHKAEKELEVWASAEKGGRVHPIATYAICATSGEPGPKRYEGDLQVPEGFYVIKHGWPESNYHLAMKVSYPNAVDRALGPKDRSLGGQIMIHGKCASIGCLAMSDERAEELWVMMRAMGPSHVQVHLYPARDMAPLLEDPLYEKHHAFWKNIAEGRAMFEKEHRLPIVKANSNGQYTFR